MAQSIVIRDTGVAVTDILRGLAKGYTPEQILNHLPKLTAADIMAAAKIAHDLIMDHVTSEREIRVETAIELRANNGRLIDVTKVRQEYPRAYEKWETHEDNRLIALHREGVPLSDIAVQLQRQPGAVSARLRMLGEIGRDRDSRGQSRSTSDSSTGS
mgnify:CR=1 FL=1